MTTGFMARGGKIGFASLTALVFLLAPLCARATDIAVVALFSGKAVLVVDGGKPRTLSIGQTTSEGVKLVSASSEAAVIELNGQRQTLTTGSSTRIGGGSGTVTGSGQTTLMADSRGHFISMGAINGMAVRFMVDTGASTVALSADEAKRLGINYLAGLPGRASTANGTVPAYRVKLDSVRVGDITLTNVDGMVVDGGGLNIALLGMSFLNRTAMKRDGDTLTLVRRY
jgi:aspartyl protease family protein